MRLIHSLVLPGHYISAAATEASPSVEVWVDQQPHQFVDVDIALKFINVMASIKNTPYNKVDQLLAEHGVGLGDFVEGFARSVIDHPELADLFISMLGHAIADVAEAFPDDPTIVKLAAE